MKILKRLGGLLVGAIDGAVIAELYAAGANTRADPTMGAIIGGIIGLIFPTLAFIVCIPIAIYFIKHWKDHDPRNNPQNRINC